MTPLETLVRAEIAARGPMRIDRYMALCLAHPEHGYYVTRDPFGAGGDFVTAPEISQMFGELLGLWAIQVWQDQGRPDPFVLAELGPGRGTLMRDMLRAGRVMPGFLEAARTWLVETSPVLRACQAHTLEAHAPEWAGSLERLPRGPAIVIANEFFDALPVRQFRRADPGWQERQVTIAGDGALAFCFAPPRSDPRLDAAFAHLPDGVIVELGEAARSVAAALAARIAAGGGAALILDYGQWDGTGDTLQAVRGHAPADPLAAPGGADLTTHVRFRALAEAAGGIRVSGPAAQGDFLKRLGIDARAAVLARTETARGSVTSQHHRLTHATEMGQLVKALAFTPVLAPPPPGFNA